MRVDRPIIFSAPMIRALLDGRKTMTRRLAWQHHTDATKAVADPRLQKSLWQRVKPGDRLWVRENVILIDEPRDRGRIVLVPVFAADRAFVLENGHRASNHFFLPRRSIPSIHMPRWASRLTLTVTATKIERLQEIGYRDCEAEGCIHVGRAIWNLPGTDWVEDEGYKMFRRLWNSLHGDAAWAANPEVVALTFTVEKRNIDAGDWRDVPSDTEPKERA